jgi:RNA polymerase sigma factor (TIGR02999 family)
VVQFGGGSTAPRYGFVPAALARRDRRLARAAAATRIQPVRPSVPPDDPAVGAHPADTLFVELYDELRRLAHSQIRAIDARASLRTTELVHEAYLKLGRAGHGAWEGRGHFFATAARAMRQVLVDLARGRLAGKRGGDRRPVSLSDADVALEVELDGMLDLDAALGQLGRDGPRLRQIVELRFFGGLPQREIAQLLGVSERTVERDWLKARLYLLREMERAVEERGT